MWYKVRYKVRHNKVSHIWCPGRRLETQQGITHLVSGQQLVFLQDQGLLGAIFRRLDIIKFLWWYLPSKRAGFRVPVHVLWRTSWGVDIPSYLL